LTDLLVVLKMNKPPTTLLQTVCALAAAQACERASPGGSTTPAKPVASTATEQPSAVPSPSASTDGMVLIKGAMLLMGTDDAFPYEGPAHRVTMKFFWIDRHKVTVGEFARFAKTTNYKTEAEKFGWSGVFDVKAGEWKEWMARTGGILKVLTHRRSLRNRACTQNFQ
jgi:formylglycine-generating enzyme